MKIKQLKHKIDVYGKQESKNEIGETEHIDCVVKTTWSAIIPKTGSMGQRAGTQFAEMTHKVLMRYEAGKDISNEMYFMYGTRRFDIMYKLDPYEQHQFFEFFCKEVIE